MRCADDAEPVRHRDACLQRRAAAIRRSDAHSHDWQGDQQPPISRAGAERLAYV